MQLRYAFRLEPTPFQQMMPARTFGCARVVFNDALALRRAAYTAKEPWIGAGGLSKTVLTQGKKREGRRGWVRCPRWCCSSPCGISSPPTVPSSTPAAEFHDLDTEPLEHIVSRWLGQKTPESTP